MVIAYLDESGTHDGGRVPVVAGYFGPSPEWKRLECAWAEALPPGIAFYHAVDSSHSQNQFEGLSNVVCNALHRKLIEEVIVPHNILGFTFALDREDYQSVVHGTRAEKEMDGPFLLLFRHAVDTICDYMARVLPDEKLQLVLENNQWSGIALQRYDALKSSHWWPHRDRLIDCSFVTKKDAPPLQAADILAYEMHLEWSRSLNGMRTHPPRKSLLALYEKQIEGVRWLDRGFLALYCNMFIGLTSPEHDSLTGR